MNPWILVWLIVELLVTTALIAFGIALGRHAVFLGRSVRRFQEEIQPIAEDIAAGSDRASRTASSLPSPSGAGRRGAGSRSGRG